MSYLDWHAGMRVVCVDDHGFEGVLSEGAVYTVQAMHGGIGWWRARPTTAPIVDLVEVKNPFFELCEIPGFCALRFRPVQSRATDISIFTAMLTDAKTKVPA